jgi:hypothetical protein
MQQSKTQRLVTDVPFVHGLFPQALLFISQFCETFTLEMVSSLVAQEEQFSKYDDPSTAMNVQPITLSQIITPAISHKFPVSRLTFGLGIGTGGELGRRRT